jgi:hypothetical protein
MNEYHNSGCESSYIFGWKIRFYFWDLFGTVWERFTFCNKHHLVAMRRLEGHELGPEWKL